MQSLINYLSSHRITAIIVSIVYFLLVVLPHEFVGKIVERTLDIPLGRDGYNFLILIISLITTIYLIFWIFRNLKRHPPKVKALLWGLLGFNLILIVVSIFTILVINIELIHVLQYAIMAIFVFAVFQNFRESLFWGTFLGALDELYQYQVLAPDKNDYFDFNDVIINLLGVALGLILIRAKGFSDSKQLRKKQYSSATVAIIVITVVLIAGMGTGYFELIANEDNSKTVFIFIKEYNPGFWHELPPNVKFHIVRPVEGLIILILLFNVFKNIGYKFDNIKQDS